MCMSRGVAEACELLGGLVVAFWSGTSDASPEEFCDQSSLTREASSSELGLGLFLCSTLSVQAAAASGSMSESVVFEYPSV